MALTALLNENTILLTDVCTIKCSGSTNQFLKNHKICELEICAMVLRMKYTCMTHYLKEKLVWLK